jgi:hypothetical protein
VLTTDGHDPDTPAQPAGARPGAPALRVAVALGDAGRELALLVALGEAGDMVVAERCLSAEQLLTCARAGRVDVLLVALDLHRLSASVLEELGRTGRPMVLLGAADAEGAHHAAAVLPSAADMADVRGALLAAARGERVWRPAPTTEEQPEAPLVTVREETLALSVLALASGHGSPGRTTVALNLAAALGAVSPTVLVDADLGGPSLAAHLDLDPTRNLYMAKYGASLVLATQSLARLDALDREHQRALRATLFANLDGLFAFHTSAEDARYLVPELGDGVDVEDLVSLGEHRCYARLSVGRERLPVFSVELDPPPPDDPDRRDRLIAESTQRYGRDRLAAEDDLRAALDRIARCHRPDPADAPTGAPGHEASPAGRDGDAAAPAPCQPRKGRAAGRARNQHRNQPDR